MATAKDSALAYPSPHEAPQEHRLRALEDRYRNELMNEEERLELRERILKLRRKLEAHAETVEAHHSWLESLTTSSDL
jgi:hypothetical protein